MTFQTLPGLLGLKGQFEDHGEGGRPRSAALRLMGPQSHSTEC